MSIVCLFTAQTSITALTERDLSEVQSSLWCIRHKWMQLGVALGIRYSTLEVIQRDNPVCTDDCFRAMLVTWLKSIDPTPTWKALTEALKSLNLRIGH